VTRCPSELELEAYLLDPARSRTAEHVATCARCRAEVAELQRQGDEFRREVFPRTVDAVVERSARRRWALPRWILAAAPLAAAAAVAAVVLVNRPPADYVGAKGGDLALTVLVGDAAGVRAARDGELVAARAPIRFQVRPARACRLWVLSVDGAGEVSRLYPVAGEAADARTAETLPGGAVLDGRAGPERVFAVCAPEPLAWPVVARAARAASAGGAASLRTTARLAGLPRGSAQATVLLEKQP
jgi:hypothetical protein